MLIKMLNTQKYFNLSDMELKEKISTLNLFENNDFYDDIIVILVELIKRLYGYSFIDSDIEKLNDFDNGIYIDCQNSDAFFPFLIHTIIKDFQKEKIHCLFEDNFLARKYFLKALRLYNFLDIEAHLFLNMPEQANIKGKIYSTNIIYSDWKNIAIDYLSNLNKEQDSDKINIEFSNAFIFDIDRVMYDFEKIVFKLQSTNAELKACEFFNLYKNITGVSPCLFFEKDKIEKKNLAKIKFSKNGKKNLKIVYKNIKFANEEYYSSRFDKIRALSQKIEQLSKNNETIVVDVDNIEDLDTLVEYLKLKKIEYRVISTESNLEDKIFLNVLTPSKITIFIHLLAGKVEAKFGGDWEEISFKNTYAFNEDFSSESYKEKLENEQKVQKDIVKKNQDEIIAKGGINILFASHYTELKNEYMIIQNYINVPIKKIIFFNSPEDELFQDLKINHLNLFSLKQNKFNNFLFKIFSRILFYLRKSISKTLIEQEGYLFYKDGNSEIIEKANNVDMKQQNVDNEEYGE